MQLVRIYAGKVNVAHFDRILAETKLNQELNIDEKFVQIGCDDAEKITQYRRLRFESITSNFFGTVLKLKKLYLKHKPDFLFCHGFKSILYAWAAKLISFGYRPKIIYEIHGAIAYESYERNKGRSTSWLRFFILYAAECWTILVADKYLLVSNVIKNYYPFFGDKKTLAVPRLVEATDKQAVVPNSEDLSRLKFFCEEMHAANKTILVYSGGVGDWQQVDKIIELMRLLIDTGKFVACVFSYELDYFYERLDCTSSSSWYFANFKQEELLAATAYCDIGILFRENIVLNRVASPTKLYQYFYCQLAVLTTDVMIEAADIIDKTGAGLIFQDDELSDMTTITQKIVINSPKINRARKELVNLKDQLTWYGMEENFFNFYNN